MPVEHGVQRRGQCALVDARGQLEHDRHGEAVDPAAVLEHVLRHRLQRQLADAAALELREHRHPVLAVGGHLGQPLRGAALEDLPRGQLQAPGAGAGHDLDGAQAVAAHGEEVVVDADPVHAEHVRVRRGDDLLGLGARLPVGLAQELRLRQRRAVELAGRAERQLADGHEGRRHHVVGQPCRDELAQLGGRGSGLHVHVADAAGAVVTDGPFAGVHHVGDEPAPVRAHLAADHHGLADTGVLRDRRFHLGGLDAEAAHLHLAVTATDALQLAACVPAGQVARAVHPLAGGERVRHEALGGQARAVVVAAAEAGADHVQLTDHALRRRGEARAQHVGAHVPQRGADGRDVALRPLLGRREGEGGGVEALALPVGVHDLYVGQGLADLAHQSGREHVAREDDRAHVGRLVQVAHEFAEHGGDTADDVAVPAVPLGERQRVRHDLGGAAGGQGGQQLEDRDVEVHRGAGEHLPAGRRVDDAHQLLHAVDDAAVGDRRALRLARGAGGVHHVRQVVRAERRDAAGVVQRPPGRVPFGAEVEVDARHVVLRQVLRRRGVGDHETRARLGEHGLRASGEVLRVHRHVAGTGLEDAEQADDEVFGARQGQDHQVLRPGTAPDQLPRDGVRPVVELPVGQRPAVAQDRRGVRRPGRLALEQLRDRQLGRRGGVVVEPDEQEVPLGRVEHVDAADGALRVGHELAQHAHEAVREALDRRPVEQVGDVLQTDSGAAGAVRDHVEEQVELGRSGLERLGLDTEAGELQVPQGLLPGEHHLEVRVVGRGPVRVEQLHQALERHVLVVVRGKGPVPHPLEQLEEARVPGEVDAQHPGVDEEPDEVPQLLVGAAGDRRAEGYVVTAAEVVQEHRQRRLHDHRHRGVLFRGHLLHGAEQVGLDRELDQVAAGARHLGARAVRRQGQRLDHVGQGPAPVLQLPGRQAVRVGLVAEHVLLPQRVVRVLHRERLPHGGVAVLAGRVRRGEVAEQRPEGLAVQGDVVHHEDQGVVERAGPHQRGADRHVGGQVEGLDGSRVDRRPPLLLRDLDDRQFEGLVAGRQHLLVRDAVVALDDHRAEDFVPVDDIAERRLKRTHVQLTGQPQGESAVVGRRRAFEPVHEPQPTLRERQRDHCFSKSAEPGSKSSLSSGRAGSKVRRCRSRRWSTPPTASRSTGRCAPGGRPASAACRSGPRA